MKRAGDKLTRPFCEKLFFFRLVKVQKVACSGRHWTHRQPIRQRAEHIERLFAEISDLSRCQLPIPKVEKIQVGDVTIRPTIAHPKTLRRSLYPCWVGGITGPDDAVAPDLHSSWPGRKRPHVVAVSAATRRS